MKCIIFVTLLFSLVGCTQKQRSFSPALEKAITEMADSLKDKTELLSIQFFNYRDNDNCTMRIFSSNWYASGSIDGFIKKDGIVIAIYNIQYDYYELVNKNAITYFTDTLIGFRDVFVWETSEQDLALPQAYYSISSANSIEKILSKDIFGDFPCAEVIRQPKWINPTSYTPQRVGHAGASVPTTRTEI